MLSLLAAVMVASAPQVVEAQEAPCDDGPALIAVKVMPGYGARLFAQDGPSAGFGLSAGLEVRLTGWLALRSDVDFRRGGHSLDFLGIKLSLDRDTLRPFASLSVGGDFPAERIGNSWLALTGALGLDVALGRNFFLTAEARARTTKQQPLTGALLVGVGVAFL